MERKTKHRIIGILIAVGIVIILLPLFQTTNDLPSEASLIKAPPFPGQEASIPDGIDTPLAGEQAITDQPPVFQNPPSNQNKLKTDDTISEDSPARKPIESEKSSSEESQKQSDNTDNTPVPAQEEEQVPATSGGQQTTDETPETDKAVSQTDTTAITQHTTQQIFRNSERKSIKPKVTKTAKLAVKKVKVRKAVHQYSSAPKKSESLPLDSDGLFQLKQPVWVIQLGSFKNKANAARLVNQLRGKGYTAFLQQASAQTRVYVGPESQQASARALAGKLKTEMKLSGLVISYKPLAL